VVLGKDFDVLEILLCMVVVVEAGIFFACTEVFVGVAARNYT